MTKDQIIRAWKDEEFRSSLSELELSVLPEHPAGMVQISDDEMGNVGGQATTGTILDIPSVLCPLTATVGQNTAWLFSCHIC